MRVRPAARAPKRTYRCEMDLSPGTNRVPEMWFTGESGSEDIVKRPFPNDMLPIRLMLSDQHLVRLVLPSSFDLLDLVQLLSDRLSEIAALDEDTTHWVSVAVRESVINAVKHGNREDPDKHVTVEFALAPRAKPEEFRVTVLDEGEGFDFEEIGDPLAPENLLKSSGRGIFFMRNFMDDVSITRRPEGGMAVSMLKRLA